MTREEKLAKLAGDLAGDMEATLLTMEALALVLADRIVNGGHAESGIDLCCNGLRKLTLYHIEALRRFNASPEGKAALTKLNAPDGTAN
jgi:hypothetical protein